MIQNVNKEKYFHIFAFLGFFLWLFAGSVFFIVPIYVIGPKVSGLPLMEYINNIQLVTEHTYIPASLAHFLGIIIFIILYKKAIKDDAINFKNKWLKNVLVIVVGFVLLYLSNIALQFIYDHFKITDAETSANQQGIIDALFGSTRGFVILYTVILAPIFEEIVFRKLLFNVFRKNTKLPMWAVVLIVSCLFAGIHVTDVESFIFFPQYFVLALIITSAYAFTKENLYVCIGLHFLNNLVSVLEIIL